jgi:asparagine synthase (glutamine-hydrolysing)
MCGVAGIFDHQQDISVDALKRMRDVLVHRGPDDQGLYAEQGVGLAHTRLSIIELSEKGHQPMMDPSGRYVVVYNGEIYNYKAIRAELETLGHGFQTGSDTEVVLKSYIQWGAKCLDRFRGMFALAIFDKIQKELFLARDRFGIKPLYYYSNVDKFIFGSEIKAILASGMIDKKIDPQGVFSFLSLGYVLPPSTIYEGIKVLEAGHCLKVSCKGQQDVLYSDLRDVFMQTETEISSFEHAKHEIRRVLLDSVRHHLISDVDVGVFLSGGIDSSSLVALAKESGHKHLKTVTVAFRGTSFDESEHAALVAREFGADHTEVAVGPDDVFGCLDDIFCAMDQPTVDGINTYCVSLAAKKAGLKAILSGLGGDEIFGGYPSFSEVPKLHQWQRMNRFMPGMFPLAFVPENKREKLKCILESKSASLAEAYLLYRGVFAPTQISRLLNPDRMGADVTGRGSQDDALEGMRNDFDKISFLETRFYMQGQLLRDTDVFSMRHSLEIRVPFVDQEVFASAARIPVKYKQRGGAKGLLVEAVGNLPSRIFRRRKQGFTFPFDLWLRGNAGQMIQDELRGSKVFRTDGVKEIISLFEQKKIHWSRIWALFVLNRFLK